MSLFKFDLKKKLFMDFTGSFITLFSNKKWFNNQIYTLQIDYISVDVFQLMEHTLKKKTKHLITLKTNNFIDNQIDTERFFSQLLQTLQSELTPQQFSFLTTYLLFNPNTTQKKIIHQTKNLTLKRIQTLPDQRAFHLFQIDPGLFHDKPNKQQNFVFRKSLAQIHQIDFNCTNTPKKTTKHLIFQNKRIMDLDKKLKKNYQNKKNLIVYNPKILNSHKQNRKQNNKSEQYFIKTAFQKSFKRSGKKEELRRLRTSFTQKNEEKVNQQRNLDFNNSILKKSIRKSETNERYPSERLKKCQNLIPKHILEQVILSRRYDKLDNSFSDFSDFKLSSRYRDCFS